MSEEQIQEKISIPQRTEPTLYIVISDFHMGTGIRRGKINTHEEFYADHRFKELLDYYSTGEFQDRSVELVIAGDFLDLLKVPYRGKFVEEVTEEIAANKARRCLRGHPVVFDAVKEFIHKPGKRAVYIPGNHDQDVFFPLVQRLIQSRVGALDRPDLFRVYTDDFYYRLPGGVVITHGNQFETMNRFDIKQPLIDTKNGQVVNYPFGSRMIISVISDFKREEPLVGLVTPLPLFMLYGMFFKFTFSVRFLRAMVSFFLRFWLKPKHKEYGGLTHALEIMYEEFTLFSSLEEQVRKLLLHADDIRILIAGHSHAFKIRSFHRKKVYINTGTWTKFVNLDIGDLGTRTYLTYAVVDYENEGIPQAHLLRWRGKMELFEEIPN